MTECVSFLAGWEKDPNQIKPVFERFKNVLESFQGAELSFKSRPGVSYSLRGTCPGNGRDVFVLVDVVDDDPEERWLSVCFYDDQITDEKELGDWVPEGLGGEDARCFDVSEAEGEVVGYTEERIKEAWKNAKN